MGGLDLYTARRRAASYVALAILIVVFSLLWHIKVRDKGLKSFKETRVLMNTFVGVEVFAGDSTKAYRAMWAAFDEMERVSKLLSNYDPESEVCRLNAYAGKGKMEVSRELYYVLKRSVEWGRITDGAFDVTLGPVLRLWGFSGVKPQIPSKDDLQSGLKLVGYRHLLVDPKCPQVSLTLRGMNLDLGGVAKGYVVDRAVEVLKAQGIANAIVDAGGDLRVLGHNPNGQRWRIGIRHPRRVNELIGVVEVDSGAVTTSGDYERFFFKGGVRYHHIIDPRTGMPARGCVSVTILAPSALDADALATAVFVLGPQKGTELINRLPGVEGVIFYEEGGELKSVVSNGLKGRIYFNQEQEHAKDTDYRGSRVSRVLFV